LSNALGALLSLNPFHADPAIRARFESLDATIGADVRKAIAHGLERTRRDVGRNSGGILQREDVDEIRHSYRLTVDELLLLARPTADSYARPPISDFHVGVVGLEAETGNLIFGGNLEFVGAHIGNTVHGEGFVFARAFSRGTSVATICIGAAHPCAHCRQFLSEFAATKDLLLIDPLGHRLKMADLYPWPFDPDYLGEKGIVAGETRHPQLSLAKNDLPPAAAGRLTELGRRCYTPYGKSPAAIVLSLRDGAVIGGAAIESVSFNPTMSPLQAAMIDLFAHGYGAADIVDAAMVTYPGPLDYVRHARDLLGVVAPGIALREAAWA
jgi:cytidine deaminase